MLYIFKYLLKCITYILLTMLIVIFSFISCTDDSFDRTIHNENAYIDTNNNIPENITPAPGNNGLLVVTNITENSAKIQWTLATDNSPAELLQYQIVVSRNLTLFSLEEILQSGLLEDDKWSSGPVNEQTILNLLYGKQYFVNVCVRDPDNNIAIYYPATFTTIGRIYLFSAGTYTGAMASSSNTARQEINELVHKALINNYPNLPQDNHVAFISIDSIDAIKNIPEHYGLPTNWPIYSPTDKKIANSLYELLLNDDIGNTLVGFDVITDGGGEGWWSGSTEYCSCAENTCNSWTDGSNEYKGRLGKKNKTNKEWISSKDDSCNNSLYLLGLCW